MKLSSQIKIRPNTKARERCSNEQSLLSLLKGLFIKRKVTVLEETFSAPDILSRLNAAFKSTGISNLVRISHDDTEFYLDKENAPNDLDKLIEEFNFVLHSSFERFYEKISVIMEIIHDSINFRIELGLMRIHPVGEYPIQLYITGVAEDEPAVKMEKKFKLFIELLDQNISKFLEVADSNISFAKSSIFEDKDKATKEVGENETIKGKKANDCIFFPLYGVTLGETTVSELAMLGVKATDCDSNKRPYQYYTINDLQFWHDSRVANHMYLTYTTPLPKTWQNCGLNWDLSYEQWKKLFKKLNFNIAIVRSPKIEWYNGQQTLCAEFHAQKKINKDTKLSIEVYFNYSKRSSVMSHGTVYSLRFRVN